LGDFIYFLSKFMKPSIIRYRFYFIILSEYNNNLVLHKKILFIFKMIFFPSSLQKFCNLTKKNHQKNFQVGLPNLSPKFQTLSDAFSKRNDTPSKSPTD